MENKWINKCDTDEFFNTALIYFHSLVYVFICSSIYWMTNMVSLLI